MRWVVIAIFAIVGFILALLATGAMLPEKHVVSRSLTVNRPISEVWQVLTDHAEEPKWRPDVESVARVADRNGHPVWEEKYRNGDTMLIETTLVNAPQRSRNSSSRLFRSIRAW
ncbi:MAG: SRPBCC family protein [Terriglobales bacterium]